MLARIACWSQFAIEEYKSCGGVQENNEVGGKILECGRVLDFAVCLRVSGRATRFWVNLIDLS
jgi:hypothetical protein